MPRIPAAHDDVPRRRPGRPAKPKAGLMARAMQREKEAGAKAKAALSERMTEYAFQDAGFGKLPIFRPTAPEQASEIDLLFDNASTGLTDTVTSVALNGYAVRLPGLTIKDKTLADEGYPDGLPIALVAICPFGASIADEDLLMVLLCLGVLGSSDKQRAKLLDMSSQFVLSRSAEARETDSQFEVDFANHLHHEIVAEFVRGGAQDQSVVEGHRFRIRCRTEILLREWLGRSDLYASVQLRRSLARLSSISYLARRAGGNAYGEWGGLKLLRYAINPEAHDGRDLTVEFSPRLVVAMFGLVTNENKRVRNAYARMNLRERFALPRGIPRRLHSLLSVEVWEQRKRPRRGRPSKIQTATREFHPDPLVDAIWGPPEEASRRRRRADRVEMERQDALHLLRSRRQDLMQAFLEIARLPGWSISENPISGTIKVTRAFGADEDDEGQPDLVLPPSLPGSGT